MDDLLVTPNPWQALRSLTAARIALGRVGVSLPTSPQLDFQLAHARARDAVHLPLDSAALAQALRLDSPDQPAPVQLASAAPDRWTYLQRPDLGRQLNGESQQRLQTLASPARRYDLALVVVDGLSALAIARHAGPLIRALRLRLQTQDWFLAPTTIVTQGRVAIGDAVGQLLNAQNVVVLVGERPGLSAPDSMGLYLTWEPRVGLLDAARNCISNVRPEGLSYTEAAYRLHKLLSEARRRQLSGVDLKDETVEALDGATNAARNFMLA
jgi:ethanolamine ammonia-lyase small subunit